MKKRRRRAALVLACAIPVAALAHHGWSEYDSANALKLTGQIVDSGYEHPHTRSR